MSVKSSGTVFRALRRLATETRPIGAAELAKSLDVPVTTAVRALATLEAAGYAERHQSSARFVIGRSARTIAYAFMAQFPIRDLATPYLQRLTLETGLTSSLFVRLGWFAVRIGRILGPSMLLHQKSLGEGLPLTSGAPGLALLAHFPPTDYARATFDLDKTTQLALVMEACAAVRRDAVAVAPSLTEPALYDLAAPLIDKRDRAIGSVAIEGLSDEALRAAYAPGGAVRQVIADLAGLIRSESVVELSHYDHIAPDDIAFQAGGKSEPDERRRGEHAAVSVEFAHHSPKSRQ